MNSTIKDRLVLAFFILLLSDAFSQRASEALLHFQNGESCERTNIQRAFSFFKQASKESLASGDLRLYLRTLNKLATLDGITEKQIHEVFDIVRTGLRPLEDVPKDIELSDLHFNCAFLYQYYSYESDSAISHYKISKDIRTDHFGEWHESVAKCYEGLGYIYKFSRNEFMEAERCYEKALQIRERINSPDVRAMAMNYYSLAATNRSQRDFEKALSYGIKTISIVEKMRDPDFLERTYNTVANIYRDMNETSRAIEYYRKAISLNIKTKNQKELLASYYFNLGEALKNESAYTQALQNFSKARFIYDRIIVSDKLRFVYCLYQMAETYLLNGERKKSLSTYFLLQKTLKELRIDNGRQVSEFYLALGDYYSRSHDNDSSIFYYQKALKSAVSAFRNDGDNDPSEQMIGLNYYVYRILNKKAIVFKDMYSRTRSEVYLAKSLECLLLSEKLIVKERNTMDWEDSKWRFLDSHFDIYEQIISTLRAMHEIHPSDSILHQVFQYFERSKARSLSEALSEAEGSGQINESDTLFKKQNDLVKAIFNQQYELSAEPVSIHVDSGRMERMRDELVKLDRQAQTNKLAIEEKFPGYFNAKYNIAVPRLKDIQIKINSQGQRAIEYFFGRDSVYAIGISGTHVLVKNLCSTESLREDIVAFLKHFNTRHSPLDKNAFQDFTLRSHRIYQALVFPFKTFIAGSTRLLIIPDGPLAQIPFEALIQKENQSNTSNYRALDYLIRSYAVGYAYSLATFQTNSIHSSKTPSVLAISFSRDNSDVKNFQAIQGSEKELKMLAGIMDGGKFLNGIDASEANFKKHAPSVDIIHLAVHGRGNVDEQYASSLYFNTSNDSLEDNELHSYELYGLKLKARLVVLSACESGLGQSYKGEGMMSMASGFAYAGCENILMSLWNVNDQASVSLMEKFYAGLLEGKNLDEALALTKIQYLSHADELSADPQIWASLIIYGRLNPLVENGRSRIYFYSCFFIAAFSLLLYFLKRKNKNRSRA